MGGGGQGAGDRVLGAGCRVKGAVCRVQGASVPHSSQSKQNQSHILLRSKYGSHDPGSQGSYPGRGTGRAICPGGHLGESLGLRNEGSEFRVKGEGCRVQGAGCRV